jgi:thiamine biosynthesis lipoprotein
VLGTRLELGLWTHQPAQARRAKDIILAEIERLESCYSRFQSTSELRRWQALGQARLSPDLLWLLQEAQRWQQLSKGAFHPAASAGLDVRANLWQTSGPWAKTLTPWPLDFNALAKGRIADLACAAALRVAGVEGVWVNLGGDLAHQGSTSLEASLAQPFSRADNLPPLSRVRVQNCGLATSGSTQRGAHLIDPRSTCPATHIAQASVLAPDAATADVLATVCCILTPPESLGMAR